MTAIKQTKRQLQAESTKRQIFEAALRLLDNMPFEKITVRDIVKEANVSVGSFYHAYNSKLSVFYETYLIADQYFEDVVHPRLVHDTVQQRILYFFEEYAVYSSEVTSQALTKILYNSNNSCFHRKSDYGMMPILEELIQQAQNEGVFCSDPCAREIAEFFMVCIRGLVYDWCICDCSFDLKARVKSYVQRLMLSFYQNLE